MDCLLKVSITHTHTRGFSLKINELNMHLKESGFEHIMFFPHVYFENYFTLTEEIYADCKRNYPSIELIDLVCPSIYIGLKKPIF